MNFFLQLFHTNREKVKSRSGINPGTAFHLLITVVRRSFVTEPDALIAL